MSDAPCSIYGLADPISGDIRYIGKSIDPTFRLKTHIAKAKFSLTYKDRWINSLLSKGLSPILVLIESTTTLHASVKEIFWIAAYKCVGARLTNATLGGEGTNGVSPSQATRDKLRLKQFGVTPWNKGLHIPSPLKGRSQSVELIEKRAAALRRTTCRRGHLYDYSLKSGRKVCLQCWPIFNQRRYIEEYVNAS